MRYDKRYSEHTRPVQKHISVSWRRSEALTRACYRAADFFELPDLIPDFADATDPAREPAGDGVPVLPMLFVRGSVSDASAIGGTGVAASASSLVASAPASPPYPSGGTSPRKSARRREARGERREARGERREAARGQLRPDVKRGRSVGSKCGEIRMTTGGRGLTHANTTRVGERLCGEDVHGESFLPGVLRLSIHAACLALPPLSTWSSACC